MSPRQLLTRQERTDRILTAAAELFYSRGVHDVGMDELIRATGLGKATVYRLYPTKDDLIAAYLARQAETIFGLIDADVARARGPAAAIRAIFAAIAADLGRAEFRGCAFNNASIEFADPGHPARIVARDYRAGLRARLTALATELRPGAAGRRLGDQLALIVDGMYTSAAHLGPDGPAAAGPRLVRDLLRD
jgi:AcrR family transcriptional regulator